MNVESLWGNLPVSTEIKPPITILREQAAILSDATNKILVGEAAVKKNGQNFELSLHIIAPAVDNYMYTALFVTHNIMLYPLTVISMSDKSSTRCEDEVTYRGALKSILSSPATHRVISSLISQSKLGD